MSITRARFRAWPSTSPRIRIASCSTGTPIISTVTGRRARAVFRRALELRAPAAHLLSLPARGLLAARSDGALRHVRSLAAFRDRISDYWLRVGKEIPFHHLEGPPLAGSRLHAGTKTLSQRVPAHEESLQVVLRHGGDRVAIMKWLRAIADFKLADAASQPDAPASAARSFTCAISSPRLGSIPFPSAPTFSRRPRRAALSPEISDCRGGQAGRSPRESHAPWISSKMSGRCRVISHFGKRARIFARLEM